MSRLEPTDRHVVLVHDEYGKLIHSHQVVYFGQAARLNNDELRAEALEAAARSHPEPGRLVATVGSEDELGRLMAAARAATLPRATSAD